LLHADLAEPLRTIDLEVDLDVAAGTCLAIAGPSGAGKTTILRAIAGLVRTRRAIVTCAEETWADTHRGRWVAPEDRRCALVFQDYALFPHLSAWRNVAYGLRGPRRRERALAALERFGVADLADGHPRELSGGERQRVALARALARNPRALLLDEPFASLDPVARRELRASLRTWLREWRLPALIVSHDPADAVLADRVAVVEHGRVVQQGTIDELRGSAASSFVAGFTDA
jgi:molybdate transport system ATP-binding protein